MSGEGRLGEDVRCPKDTRSWGTFIANGKARFLTKGLLWEVLKRAVVQFETLARLLQASEQSWQERKLKAGYGLLVRIQIRHRFQEKATVTYKESICGLSVKEIISQ